VSTAAAGLPRGGDAAPGSVPAPPAPGRMGAAPRPEELLAYLDALGQWRDARRAELDLLDRAALEVAHPERLTGDVTLAMALWQAVAGRHAVLLSTWDSGRVGPTERERMAALIWGRLDTSGTGAVSPLAVSLPEACRLCDALVGELRERVGLDPSGRETTARIGDLRAQLERIRDQVGLEPAGPLNQSAAERSAALARRLAAVVAKADRGGDVAGLLGPIEIAAATFERDLIVGAARRREAGALVSRVRAARSDLVTREQALRALVERCVATVRPAPRYAVPDVAALGPLPNTAVALAGYETRLQQVGRALALAEQAYAAALREHDDAEARLAALRVKAEATGRADEPDLTRAYTMAREALDARPSPLGLVAQLVTLYATYLETEPR
jgi:hypothetical protein